MAARFIWVTGAGGLIGHHLVATARECAPDAEVLALTRPMLDLTDFSALKDAFLRRRPGLVIHCAALSRSPDCQANPAFARKINVDVTATLAELADRLVFFSTDLVFDGRAGNYDESAAVNPLSVYAETKVAAEQIVLANPNHLVVRTSLNCGISPTRDRGFDEQLLRAWESGQTLRLFTDEFRSPIPAQFTARAIWELVAQNKTGIYNVAGAERLSRWQIGQLFVARFPHFQRQVEPSSLKEYKGAPRSPDTSLNCAKAQRCLSFPLPHLSQWIKSQG
ncbi:MAG TPA: SDR family oxidoreductase [Candidatus Limnocylindrales bacterium]|jgi:dTDP-4-dehydrorhamnose reductase|nr:SDR family oxidoreductase [Candidatus Limnocylindrales bacterium]